MTTVLGVQCARIVVPIRYDPQIVLMAEVVKMKRYGAFVIYAVWL